MENERPATITREKWGKQIEFILSGIGFAVGLGNIWRFPYLCYKNGGGAFLVPYFICMVTGGIPIFFLEVALGQFTSEGGITAWNICPLFKGIGYGTTIICFLLNVYYIVILAWALHYFVNSFSDELPWTTCDNWWNTPNCFYGQNYSSDLTLQKPVDPVKEYWERKVLQISSGIDDIGRINWELALCLLVVWIIIFLCVKNGIKTSGKVVYFTAIFPYFMLTALLIRGLTLKGAMKGLEFYLKPDFSKLTEAEVWKDAGTQIFFSYAIALGCMIALGSYNKFNNNFSRDCIFISIVNSSTSLYSGLAVFSVLGFMAEELGVPVSKVAESGPGLVFIAYPKAVTQMQYSSVWSALFFFMIILIGLDSQFVGVEGFVTAVVDIYPGFLRQGRRREALIVVVIVVSYVIGLLMVTNGGMYVLNLFDNYAVSGPVLLWFSFFECIAIAYCYGVDNFYDNITSMLGYEMNFWMRTCWRYCTPLVTMGIMIFSALSPKPLTYNEVYIYPYWAVILGWAITLVPICFIPLYFFWHLFTRPGNLAEKWKLATEPMISTARGSGKPIPLNPL